MAGDTTQSIVAWSLLVLIAVSEGPHALYGAGLNTNVALTPPQDGTILRAQWRYSRLFGDPTPLDREVLLSVQPITLVHGLTADFAVLATVPIIRREIKFGSGAKETDTGIGDIPLLVKYRFFQEDELGKTTRWAAIGGLEVPSFDNTFSSESFDPIIGTVWTHQERDWWVDADLLYKFNTAWNRDEGVVVGAVWVATQKRVVEVEPVGVVSPAAGGVDPQPEEVVGVGIGRGNDGKGCPDDAGCQDRFELHVGISFFPAGHGHRMWNEPGARPTSVAWRTGYKLGSQRIKQKMVTCHM